MAHCLWTKPSLKSKTKAKKRCGLTKSEAMKAAKRARSSGKAAGVYSASLGKRKAKSSSRRRRSRR